MTENKEIEQVKQEPEQSKEQLETKDFSLFQKAKGIKTKGIVGLILIFTLIGGIVTLILNIICGIKILATDWKNSELESQKVVWGILCFVILGPISAIVFGSIATNKLSN